MKAITQRLHHLMLLIEMPLLTAVSDINSISQSYNAMQGHSVYDMLTL